MHDLKQYESMVPRPILLTKELAVDLLKKDDAKGRRISKNRVNMYANDMLNGKWNADPSSPFIVTKDGKLRNGRHRCHAVIQSQKEVVVFLAKDIPQKEVLKTLDAGKARSKSDMLVNTGLVPKLYANTVAFAGLYAIELQHNKVKSKEPVSNHDLITFIEENPLIINCAEDIATLVKEGDFKLIPAWLSTYYFWELGAEFYPFFEKLHTGILEKDSAIYRLRSQMRQWKEKRIPSSRFIKIQTLLKTIKYWHSKHPVNSNIRLTPKEKIHGVVLDFLVDEPIVPKA